MVFGDVHRAATHNGLSLSEALQLQMMLADNNATTYDRRFPDAYAINTNVVAGGHTDDRELTECLSDRLGGTLARRGNHRGRSR